MTDRESSTCGGGGVGQQVHDRKLEEYLEREALGRRMDQIKHKILILSGKGGSLREGKQRRDRASMLFRLVYLT